MSPVNKIVSWFKKKGLSVGINDASILSMCMLCQPYICAPEYRQSWDNFVITDSYYTRHTWALGLSVMSDKKVRILSAVMVNYINKYLHELVKEKMKEFDNVEQGTWCLIRCWHVKDDYKEQEKAHKAQKCARIAKLKGKKNLKMAPFKPQLEFSENFSSVQGLEDCPVLYISIECDDAMWPHQQYQSYG